MSIQIRVTLSDQSYHRVERLDHQAALLSQEGSLASRRFAGQAKKRMIRIAEWLVTCYQL
jgi:hypothetical protein